MREAVDTLRGADRPDFAELVLASAAHLLALSDLGVDEAEGGARSRSEGRRRLCARLRALDPGAGGDPSPDALRSRLVPEVVAPHDGVVERVGAIRVGLAALHLGAGHRPRATPSTTR